MARTKKTNATSTADKAPRKRLTSRIIKKRKTPENDDVKENERKKIKLNVINANNRTSSKHNIKHSEDTETLSESHTDSSVTSSEDIDSSSQDSETSDSSSASSSSSSMTFKSMAKTSNASINIPQPMKQILRDIKHTFNSAEYKPAHMDVFAEELISLSTYHQNKLKELKFRKDALSKFLSKFQERTTYNNSINQSYKYYSKKQYFNNKLNNFTQSMVMGLRFEKYNRWEDDECPGSDHSIDFALRSVHPHPLYAQRMYKLLKKYINRINGICSIICDYSHNGYKWYQMKMSFPFDEDYMDWRDINDGIIFHLTFDESDYFRGKEYYKEQKNGFKKVMFEEMRQELETQEICDLTDKELSCFIIGVGLVALNLNVEGREDWVEKQHGKQVDFFPKLFNRR